MSEKSHIKILNGCYIQIPIITHWRVHKWINEQEVDQLC